MGSDSYCDQAALCDRRGHDPAAAARPRTCLQANRLGWLEPPPSDYVGEVASQAVATLPAGSWFFDAERREIGYLPRLSFHLSIEAVGDAAAGPAIRWRVHGVRAKNGEVEDVSLVPVTRYRWF